MCFCQCCHLILLCNNSSRLHPACTLFFTSIVLRMIRFKAAQVYKLIQLYCIYSWLLHLLLSSCSFTWSLFSLEKKNKNSKVLSLKKSCKCSWNDCFCYLTSSVFLFVVQFAGFSCESLCERIVDAQSSVLVTAGRSSGSQVFVLSLRFPRCGRRINCTFYPFAHIRLRCSWLVSTVTTLQDNLKFTSLQGLSVWVFSVSSDVSNRTC